MKQILLILITAISFSPYINGQEKNLANIYIYFDDIPDEISDKLTKGKHKLSVKVNDDLIYQLEYGSALQYKRYSQGNINLSLSNMAERRLNVEKGKSYFLGFSFVLREWKIVDGDSASFFSKYNNENTLQVKEGDEYVMPEVGSPQDKKNDITKGKNYAEINFIAYGYESMKLHLNNILVTPFGRDEIIKYKIYSHGRIAVTIISEFYRKEGWIEINENRTYYYSGYNAERLNEERIDNEAIDKKTFMNIKHMIEEKKAFTYKVIELEEDIHKPIGKIPEDFNLGGKGQGSGFLLNHEGYIITNHHVIDKAKEIRVKGIGGDFSTSYQAVVVASDPNNDLAIIKPINANLKFNDPPYGIKTGTAETGESIYVLGYPKAFVMGEEVKLTTGVISATSGIKGNIGRYQISAPIHFGNSGGPLLDNKGNIIGIINSMFTEAENASYAIKTPLLHAFILLTGKSIAITETNTIENLALNEQIKLIKDFVYIIECE